MNIRKYKSTDHEEIANLFHETVHAVCINHYTLQELQAWAPSPVDYEKWEKRLAKKKPFLAIQDNKIVGFAELEEDGHIDCFYVHKDHQRKGVGSLLFNHLEKLSYQKGLKRLYVEVSLTAKAFFEKQGFKVIKENTVHAKGQKLINFIMEKDYLS